MALVYFLPPAIKNKVKPYSLVPRLLQNREGGV